MLPHMQTKDRAKTRGGRWGWPRVGVVLVLALAGGLLGGCAHSGGGGSASGREYAPATLESLATLRDIDLRLTRLVAGGKTVSLPAETPITLRFGAPGKIAGRSAVNRYFGGFEFKEGGSVTWPPAPLGMTRMAGPPAAMDLEATFVKALASTDGLQVAPDAVRFQSGDGAQVLEFVR